MEHQQHSEKRRPTCNVRLARLYITHSVLLAVAVVWLIAVIG